MAKRNRPSRPEVCSGDSSTILEEELSQHDRLKKPRTDELAEEKPMEHMDGNEDTLNVMQQPRCEVVDERKTNEGAEKIEHDDDGEGGGMLGSENDELEGDSDSITKSIPTSKVIDLNEIKNFGKKLDRTGLIYVSRIPPGMGPSKLKHLLSKWGSIGRVYLARDEKAEESRKKTNKKGKIRKKSQDKHQSFLFKEGWVEFMDKKVARRVAEMLNTRPIGGKPSDRYYSDLWSLTYLPKFKWTNLSDQMAVERRIREQLVRNSLEESKKSQDWYLTMVEKNSTNRKIIQKDLKKNPSLTNPTRGKTLDFKQRELPSFNPQSNPGSFNNQQSSKLTSVLDGLL